MNVSSEEEEESVESPDVQLLENVAATYTEAKLEMYMAALYLKHILHENPAPLQS